MSKLKLNIVIVGAGNVSAQINLELDFTLSEETEEIVDPEQSVLRSEQNTLDTTTDGKAKGIPGALSNTPPMAAELKSSPEAATAGENVLSSSSSNVRNYEISRKVLTKKNPSGGITKIQAAVLVRETFTTNEDGIEVSSISDATKERITSLVKDVIGYNEDRGDSLTVSSSPFVSELEGVAVPWYELDWIQKAMSQAVSYTHLTLPTKRIV